MFIDFLNVIGFIFTIIGIIGGLLYGAIVIIHGEYLIRTSVDDFRIYCKIMLLQIFFVAAGIGIIIMSAPKH